MDLALAFLVLLVAAAVQAITSFGFVLLTVPVLALVFDPHTAVVAAVMSSALVTLVGWGRERAHVDLPSVRWLALGGLLGIPVGLAVFTRVEADLLLLTIGIMTILFTALMVVRVRLPAGTGTQLGAGVLSGALLTTTGTNGPPIVLALQARALAPRVFRATIQAIFTLQGVAAITGMALTGKITTLTLILFGLSIPAGLVGWRLGDRVFHRLSGTRVRQVVMVALVASGASLILSALS